MEKKAKSAHGLLASEYKFEDLLILFAGKVSTYNTVN